jgi:hypothetical protein
VRANAKIGDRYLRIVTLPRLADCRATKVHRPFRAMATQSRKRHAALVGLPYFFS